MSSPLVAPVTLASADPKAAAMLNAVKAKLGMIVLTQQILLRSCR